MIIRCKYILWILSLTTPFLGCSGKETSNLKDAFGEAFYVGAALNYDQIMGWDQASLRIVKKQFSSITAENAMKWEHIHPAPGKYNFAPADSFVAFGERNNLFIVGHTLVWHNQTPEWVFKDQSGNPVSRDTLLLRMQEHISAVVGRYKGRIQGWDVVNEAVEDNGQLRNTSWLKIIGEDYIQSAFEWAHEADPGAELYYNDFNMWKVSNRERVIQLVKSLQARGIRIDGIGMQGHWGLDYPLIDEIETSIIAYAALGVEVLITELEMDMLPRPDSYTGAEITRWAASHEDLDPYAQGLPDSMQNVIADRYAEFFRLFYKHRDKIGRVTLWGIHDGQSWRNNWPIPGRTAYPLLFDRNLHPNRSFEAVIKIAGEAK